MIKLIISFTFCLLVSSCEIKDTRKLSKIFNESKLDNNTKTDNPSLLNNELKEYFLEEPYFIEGVKYFPKEDYKYNKIGLASFYGKELHNVKTVNNDINKVTELLARHKTLPLPSVVKVTNLENGLSLTVKIIDRHYDNSTLIQVSRKSAMLLKFYKNKITKVRVEILSDPSKQMKVVTQSMNDHNFNKTIDSAPTESVSISDIDEQITTINNDSYLVQPIEIGFENIEKKDLFLKIYNFGSYNEAKKIITELQLSYKFITKNEGESYTVLIGPLKNIEANNLVLSFISKGYKKTEFILK